MTPSDIVIVVITASLALGAISLTRIATYLYHINERYSGRAN